MKEVRIKIINRDSCLLMYVSEHGLDSVLSEGPPERGIVRSERQPFNALKTGDMGHEYLFIGGYPRPTDTR